MIDPDHVLERVAALRQRIGAAGGVGVEILAVTKSFGVEAIDTAVAAGLTGIGENYAQELLGKRDHLVAMAARPDVHFIGHLQSNKVRQLIGVVDVFATLDRVSVVDEVARRSPGARALIQVNISGESHKGGCALHEVDTLVDRCRNRGLRLDGLMGVGPAADPAGTRNAFRLLRSLVDRHELAVCSMGMTDDLEIAIEEGSTQVRIGSALFGARVRVP